MVKLALCLVSDGMFGIDIRVPLSPGEVSLLFFLRVDITSERLKIENASQRFGCVGCCPSCDEFRCPWSLEEEWPIFS